MKGGRLSSPFLAHHLLGRLVRRTAAGVKVERPAGRTTLTPARTVVEWTGKRSVGREDHGGRRLRQSSIRV